MMNCVVTGGAGFIGSNLVDLLISEGHSVRVIDNLCSGRLENLNPKAEFREADVRDLEALLLVFKPGDVVFHLAALPRIQPSFADPGLHEDINVVGTLKVFEAGRKMGVKRIVFASSSAVYGNTEVFPTQELGMIDCLSPYALQKYTAEQYLLMLSRRYEVPVTCLRFFNVYGPRSFNPSDQGNAYSSVVGIFNQQKISNQPLTITGDGEQRRDFVHVRDVARACYLAGKSELPPDVYNVGYGKNYSVNEVAELFGGEKKYLPERKGESKATLADISKIEEALSWTPQISLAEGIKNL